MAILVTMPKHVTLLGWAAFTLCVAIAIFAIILASGRTPGDSLHGIAIIYFATYAMKDQYPSEAASTPDWFEFHLGSLCYGKTTGTGWDLSPDLGSAVCTNYPLGWTFRTRLIVPEVLESRTANILDRSLPTLASVVFLLIATALIALAVPLIIYSVVVIRKTATVRKALTLNILRFAFWGVFAASVSCTISSAIISASINQFRSALHKSSSPSDPSAQPLLHTTSRAFRGCIWFAVFLLWFAFLFCIGAAVQIKRILRPKVLEEIRESPEDESYEMR